MKNFKYLFLLLSTQLFAQTKPTPIEVLLGNNRIQAQTIISKSFANSKKWGVFSLTTLAGDYSNKDKSNNEVVSNIQLNYELYKGIKLATGASFNSTKGFSPILGLQYIYSKEVMIVLNPTIEMNKEISLKNFALVEFAQKRQNKPGIYARVQSLYVQNIATDLHERSFVLGRVGVFYKGFAAGLGVNRDLYGATKKVKNNFGLFLHYKFI